MDNMIVSGTLTAYLSPVGVLEGEVCAADEDFLANKEAVSDSDIDELFN